MTFPFHPFLVEDKLRHAHKELVRLLQNQNGSSSIQVTVTVATVAALKWQQKILASRGSTSFLFPPSIIGGRKHSVGVRDAPVPQAREPRC